MPVRDNPYQPPNSAPEPPLAFAGTITSRVIHTPEHFAETLARLRAQNHSESFFIAVRYLCAATCLLVSLVAIAAGGLRLGLQLLFVSIMVLVIGRLANYLAIKTFRRDPNCNKPLVITFSDEGVHVEMAHRQSMIPWRTWKQAIFFHDGVLIRGNVAYQWIPDNSLESGNTRDSLRTLVRSKLPAKSVLEARQPT